MINSVIRVMFIIENFRGLLLYAFLLHLLINVKPKIQPESRISLMAIKSMRKNGWLIMWNLVALSSEEKIRDISDV